MPEEQMYMNEKEAAEFMRRAVPTLQGWRSRGGGPKYYKNGKKGILYKKQDLINFIEDK